MHITAWHVGSVGPHSTNLHPLLHVITLKMSAHKGGQSPNGRKVTLPGIKELFPCTCLVPGLRRKRLTGRYLDLPPVPAHRHGQGHGQVPPYPASATANVRPDTAAHH